MTGWILSLLTCVDAKPGSLPRTVQRKSCAGYEGYPFQNKQGKSCVENLANDVDKEEKIGVVVIISPLF